MEDSLKLLIQYKRDTSDHFLINDLLNIDENYISLKLQLFEVWYHSLIYNIPYFFPKTLTISSVL